MKKETNQKKYFWQVAPKVDYEKALADKGLKFIDPEKEHRLVTSKGDPLPRMNQQDFEEVGDLVLGYV